jgi:hypothetical protein
VESADFVVTPGRKSMSPRSSSARQRAIRDLIARSRSLRIALWSPPTSSSLRDEKACPLAPCALLAPLAEAGASWPLPSSLARSRKTWLFARSSRDSGAPAWLSTAARDPGSDCSLPLAADRAVLDCSLPLAAMFAGCRRLRRTWRNGKALFRHLLLQIGGANIASPPTSSSLLSRRARSDRGAAGTRFVVAGRRTHGCRTHPAAGSGPRPRRASHTRQRR